jgi:hypothetical protein
MSATRSTNSHTTPRPHDEKATRIEPREPPRGERLLAFFEGWRTNNHQEFVLA